MCCPMKTIAPHAAASVGAAPRRGRVGPIVARSRRAAGCARGTGRRRATRSCCCRSRELLAPARRAFARARRLDAAHRDDADAGRARSAPPTGGRRRARLRRGASTVLAAQLLLRRSAGAPTGRGAIRAASSARLRAVATTAHELARAAAALRAGARARLVGRGARAARRRGSGPGARERVLARVALEWAAPADAAATDALFALAPSAWIVVAGRRRRRAGDACSPRRGADAVPVHRCRRRRSTRRSAIAAAPRRRARRLRRLRGRGPAQPRRQVLDASARGRSAGRAGRARPRCWCAGSARCSSAPACRWPTRPAGSCPPRAPARRHGAAARGAAATPAPTRARLAEERATGAEAQPRALPMRERSKPPAARRACDRAHRRGWRRGQLRRRAARWRRAARHAAASALRADERRAASLDCMAAARGRVRRLRCGDAGGRRLLGCARASMPPARRRIERCGRLRLDGAAPAQPGRGRAATPFDLASFIALGRRHARSRPASCRPRRTHDADVVDHAAGARDAAAVRRGRVARRDDQRLRPLAERRRRCCRDAVAARARPARRARSGASASCSRSRSCCALPRVTLLRRARRRRRAAGARARWSSACARRAPARQPRGRRTRRRSRRCARCAAQPVRAAAAGRGRRAAAAPVSASAFEALRACPYRFFARACCACAKPTSSTTSSTSATTATGCTRCCCAFHARPRTARRPGGRRTAAPACRRADAVQRASCELDAAQLPAVPRRLRRFAPRYLAWLHARRAAGWRWPRAKRELTRAAAGARRAWSCDGRIDRIDAPRRRRRAQLIDYKTGSAEHAAAQGAPTARRHAARVLRRAAGAQRAAAPLRAGYLALDDAQAVAADRASRTCERSAALLVDGLGARPARACAPARRCRRSAKARCASPARRAACAGATTGRDDGGRPRGRDGTPAGACRRRARRRATRPGRRGRGGLHDRRPPRAGARRSTPPPATRAAASSSRPAPAPARPGCWCRASCARCSTARGRTRSSRSPSPARRPARCARASRNGCASSRRPTSPRRVDALLQRGLDDRPRARRRDRAGRRCTSACSRTGAPVEVRTFHAWFCAAAARRAARPAGEPRPAAGR